MQMESAFKRLFKDYFGLFTDKTRDYLQAAYKSKLWSLCLASIFTF